MTLRRTPLARRTPMPRGGGLTRRQIDAHRTRVAKTITAGRRRTDPTPAQRRVVAERAGYVCEVCGRPLHNGDVWTETHAFHHRQPRGMGGTRRPDPHAPHELLLVCGTGNESGCHGLIETQRAIALANGWLVRRGTDALEVPVLLHTGRVVHLTDDGAYANRGAA